jgi:hypothetical protein
MYSYALQNVFWVAFLPGQARHLTSIILYIPLTFIKNQIIINKIKSAFKDIKNDFNELFPNPFPCHFRVACNIRHCCWKDIRLS